MQAKIIKRLRGQEPKNSNINTVVNQNKLKIIKLVGLKNGGRLSPINLVTFAGTQNGE